RLHADLRPVARNLTLPSIVIIAPVSSLGEELFFRGFLTPFLGGIVFQAVLLELPHQVGVPSRWVWMIWASGVGLCLGAIFVLTGSLVGPIAAHAIVNGYNLTFLRDYDPAPKVRRLGGLFAPSDV